MRILSVYSFALLIASTFGVAREVYSQPQMGICKPVAQRDRELGCWILTNKSLGELPKGRLFWHLDKFDALESARGAQGPSSTVVQALGVVWLFTIEAETWRPSGGERVAQIGPLPIPINGAFTAQYMESIFEPGMSAPPHRHPGPEAWYTVAGEACLETPEGKLVSRPGGQPVIIPGGLPMVLTATGRELRKSLVLVLHDSSQPAGIPMPDWKPRGLCTN